MRPTKNISGKCEHCGMPLEFKADAIGSTAPCPFCHKQTELTLAVPEIESGIPKRLVVLTTITLIVLLLGFLGVLLALNRAKTMARERQAPAATQPAPAR